MKNGGTLRLSPTTYAMIWMEMPGMEFSDSYQNEYAITDTIPFSFYAKGLIK